MVPTSNVSQKIPGEYIRNSYKNTVSMKVNANLWMKSTRTLELHQRRNLKSQI